jgi:N-acetyl-gamma-glutamyl-phosphate reductase common form
MSKTISAVILGATGYVGGELLRLVSAHPNFHLAAAVSNSRNGYPIAVTFPNLTSAYGQQCFVGHDKWFENIESGSDVAIFSAAPHGSSAAIIQSALDIADEKNLVVHVVDSSADFRFSQRSDYESIYATKHGAPDLLAKFTSGVPEHVAEITTQHVGHPGCFATAVLLAAVPLAKSEIGTTEIFVTGITGSTGSGRAPQPGTHHPERHGNLYAYKPLAHRHAPEMEVLTKAAAGNEIKINFVPHSGPFARGIYATLQTKVSTPITVDQLRRIYEDAYADSPFIEIVDGMPRMKNVVASNRCQIGIAINGDTVVVVSTIDNLVKGAAGGAVQWMNRLWGLPETTGLTAAAPGWT